MNSTLAKFTSACLALIVLTLLVQAAPAQETVDRVIAVVNDDVITLSEVREMALSLNPTSTQPVNERELLDKMIEQKLFEQEAEKRGVTVSDAELDASIEGVKQSNNLTDEQMVEVLKKQGLTPESFRAQWRAQTLGNKLLQTQLKGKIVVTDDEIKTYYERNYLNTGSGGEEEEEVRIAHIMISLKTSNAAQVAREVENLLKSGEDFGELAEKYSDDEATANSDGDLGYFKESDLIDSFAAAVAITPEGGVTEPVKSPIGYHVIKVLERSDPYYETESDVETVTIDDATKAEIRETLMKEKAQSQLKEWLDGIKESAYIENKY